MSFELALLIFARVRYTVLVFSFDAIAKKISFISKIEVTHSLFFERICRFSPKEMRLIFSEKKILYHRNIIAKTRPNEFGSMTAIKDDIMP